MADSKAEAVSPVPGRNCGDCSLCCKLIRVDAFDKPAGVWCATARPVVAGAGSMMGGRRSAAISIAPG
jgi:hypothetical protein